MNVLGATLRSALRLEPVRVTGRVTALRGLTMLVRDLPLPVGALVRVERSGTAGASGDDGLGEVVGFDGDEAVVMPLGRLGGIRAGDRVSGEGTVATFPSGAGLLGRCVDGLGRPIDGLGPVRGVEPRELDPAPISALRRERVREPLRTGVRAVDLFTPVGRGQRLGVFAGPGVGKSTLLGWMARRASSDVNVIGLIGERGREVRDFLEESLGADGLARSVVVVSTGDESPVMRIRAALGAHAVAEYFRDAGCHVLLMMDSLTRLAHAQRQVGLSAGEPPSTRGYTPSVFAMIPRLLERAGCVIGGDGVGCDGDGRRPGGGSITGIYTILVEGDDMTEPVADAARGVLDGHLILSRRLAQRGHFPAMDVLDSVSRVAEQVSTPNHAAARRQAVRVLAAYREVEELVQIGAYARGANAESDAALEIAPRLLALLRQDARDDEPFEASLKRLIDLGVEAGNRLHAAGSR